MTLYSHPQGHVFYRKMSHARPKIAYGKGIYLFDEDGTSTVRVGRWS